MDHPVFAALFVVVALTTQYLASAAPFSDNNNNNNKHQHHHHKKQHHQHQQELDMVQVRDIEDILRELDQDTQVLIAEKDKVIEVYPEQRELPPLSGETPLPPASSAPLRRSRRSATRRRSRRSAALLLHATLRMCNLRPLHCQSILLQRDNVRVNIRLVDQ